jgi:phosphomethylpyrimidine synthase
MKNKKSSPANEIISRQPLPGSTKIYVKGNLPGVSVAMRKIETSDFIKGENGEKQFQSVAVYDTSGPYTDPQLQIDVTRGLPPIRRAWIEQRNDSVDLPDFSSDYSRNRPAGLSDETLFFQNTRKPRRALPGKNVSQLHYARKGIITPEMEYVAIRENQQMETWNPYLQSHAAYHSGRRPRHTSCQHQPPGK